MRLLKLVPDNTNIDFMKWRNFALILSIVATVASLVLVGVRGLNLGIDFVGGQMVRATFSQPVSIEDLTRGKKVVIFGLPGMIIATIFVTLPFVVREVEPVLHEIGLDQEQAASTLGANPWQTFWRITLPAIRGGLTYGVVLTVARALGEFGAVIMVSSGFAGISQTLTLLVHSRYIDDHNTYGAYAAATVLMGLAIATLLLMTLLDRKRSTR